VQLERFFIVDLMDIHDHLFFWQYKGKTFFLFTKYHWYNVFGVNCVFFL